METELPSSLYSKMMASSWLGLMRTCVAFDFLEVISSACSEDECVILNVFWGVPDRQWTVFPSKDHAPCRIVVGEAGGCATADATRRTHKDAKKNLCGILGGPWRAGGDES